jgi:hypothetical protein
MSRSKRPSFLTCREQRLPRVGSLIVLCWLFAAACTSDSDVVDRRKCEALRDHLVELRLRAVATPKVNIEAHRAAMKRALDTRFLSRCERELTITQLRCQLSAKSMQTANACIKQ